MRDCHSSDDKDVIAIDEKRSGILMTRVAAGERFMSLCVLNNAQSGHRTDQDG